MTSAAATSSAATSSATGNRFGFGVDVGGSGIKGGVVDLTTGELVGDRHKVLTPHPATPKAVARSVAQVVEHFDWTGPVGITLPGVVTNGIMRTAANIDGKWIDTDTGKLFAKHLGDRRIAVLNDADAAGLAEERFGAGRDATGSVMLLTFGTGIGSAMLRDGVLVPNFELGHLVIDGIEAEHLASSKVKTDHGWSYEKWCKKVSKVLREYERLFWPDLFIVGGGISRKADKWVPLLTNEVPVVAAELRNTAGIVGAAMRAGG